MYTFATWPTMVKVSIHLFSATLYISIYSLSFIIRHFEYEIDGNDNVWIFWLKLIGKLSVWKTSDRYTNVMIVSEEHRVRFIQSENRIDGSWRADQSQAWKITPWPITDDENFEQVDFGSIIDIWPVTTKLFLDELFKYINTIIIAVMTQNKITVPRNL